MASIMAEPFKTCGHCKEVWDTISDFLGSPSIRFIGYQAFVRDGVLGLFLFNHLVCSTTLAIRADQLEELGVEPVHDVPEPTSRLCLTRESGEACPEACECGWANRVIDTIEVWPKIT